MINKLREIIKEVVKEDGWDVFISERGEFGHYSTNVAFVETKKTGKSLNEVAENLIRQLADEKWEEILEKIEARNGYINFWIKSEKLREEFIKVLKNKEKIGEDDWGKNETVIVEYSQPNIAKRMHVGHLRSTIIGDALARILKSQGFKVIRWNYLGDWGTQFGKLIVAYKLWGSKEEIKQNPIGKLVDLYVRFHEELKNNPDLENRGKEEFKKLEEGDGENRELWKWFKEESLKEFNKIYEILGVGFDIDSGESAYEKDMGPLTSSLVESRVAEKSEGALIIKLDKFNLPPALILKEDGASLYLTRDIASLKDRLKKFKPNKILYVVSNEQALHFEQLSAVALVLGLATVQLCHVKFGLMLGEDKKKFSTREGRGVPLEDLINKIINEAYNIVDKKNTELSEEEKQKVARIVGIGALKYNDLKENRHSDVTFDWKRMLDLRGDSASYIQYTYARLRSILRKAGNAFISSDSSFVLNYIGATEGEKRLIIHILNFNEVLRESASTFFTNNLAKYLYELASMGNTFYETTNILKDEEGVRRNSRLSLVDLITQVLKKGLDLLGIEVLEEI